MMTYLDCWTGIATALFSQALAGEPELVESFPKPVEGGSFGFAAILEGEREGRFSVLLEASILESPLLGEGAEQVAAWKEVLREIADAAVGELLAKTGQKCRVARFESIDSASSISRAFQLRSADRAWMVLVRDETHPAKPEEKPLPVAQREEPAAKAGPQEGTAGAVQSASTPGAVPGPGLELLLDVELEATVRFGCRELPLGEILELGPGDVVQLDRHVSDPVDLIVGDKIVARGEVVLVNGNFGLRVTDVAAPRKRLESIRCLF